MNGLAAHIYTDHSSNCNNLYRGNGFWHNGNSCDSTARCLIVISVCVCVCILYHWSSILFGPKVFPSSLWITIKKIETIHDQSADCHLAYPLRHSDVHDNHDSEEPPI